MVTKSAYWIHWFGGLGDAQADHTRASIAKKKNDGKIDKSALKCLSAFVFGFFPIQMMKSFRFSFVGLGKINKLHKIACYHALKTVMLSLFPSIHHFCWISSSHSIYVAQFDSPLRSAFCVSRKKKTWKLLLDISPISSLRCMECLSISVHLVAKRK